MTEFAQLFILGMCTGGLYTISGLGIVAVYKASGVINFASSAASTVGAYLCYTFSTSMGLSTPLAIVLAIVASALCGMLTYFIAIRPLTGASTLAMVFATLAILVLTQQLIIYFYGPVPLLAHDFLPTQGLHLTAGIVISENRLILLVLSIILTGILWVAFRATRIGVAVTALSESQRSVAALGWRVERIRVLSWTLGGALAGLAGVALAPTLQLSPTAMSDVLIPALACALIGELRSFPLTLVGGLVLGGLQATVSNYITLQGVGDALPFIAIVLVMVVRGKALPLRSFRIGHLPRVGSGTVSVVRVAIYSVGTFVVVYFFVNDNIVAGATITLVMAIILLSQIVITGYAGQLSLAQLTIAGVGGIVAAKTSVSWHLPFLAALVVGALFAIPISVVVAVPALRARGFSLAIATLGFAVALTAVVLSNTTLIGGVQGLTLSPQSVFGFSIDPILYPQHYFAVVLVAFVLIALVVANIRRGRVGRRMLAVRGNERAASALGINVAGTKLYAFTVAGVIASIGGTLSSFQTVVPQFDGYDAFSSLALMLTVVLAGVGYIEGALVGGLLVIGGLPTSIIYPLTENWSWWNAVFPMISAFAVTIQLAYNSNGLLDAKAHGSRRKQRRLAAERSAAAASGGMETRRRRPILPAGISKVIAATTFSTARQLKWVEAAEPSFESARLEASGVRVRFGSVVAVDDLSFTVDPGEVLGIIGPNGAGKTTLMDAVTGFVRSSGVVRLGGTDISAWSTHRRARAGLTRSFQTLELLDDMTVLDNIRCAADDHDRRSMLFDLVHPARGELTGSAHAAIRAFHLDDKLDRLPTELTFGDRRLLAVARAVAARPKVILLDEPAAGLSEGERRELVALIGMMAREWQLAVILIEHDVELVRRVSDRVIALDFGRQIAVGSPAEVLSTPAVVAAYLGIEADAEASPPSRDTPADPAAGPTANRDDVPSSSVQSA
jgi:ABC-type branched-subunit amino acid transport system ATPase component/branched-subunit amino acid ABC-type transport system permease component